MISRECGECAVFSSGETPRVGFRTGPCLPTGIFPVATGPENRVSVPPRRRIADAAAGVAPHIFTTLVSGL